MLLSKKINLPWKCEGILICFSHSHSQQIIRLSDMVPLAFTMFTVFITVFCNSLKN